MSFKGKLEHREQEIQLLDFPIYIPRSAVRQLN